MFSVGSAVGVNGATFRIPGQSNSASQSGALAMGRTAIGRALGSTGFVHVVGPLNENFETYLSRKPFEIEVGELKPGTIPEVRVWVASKISAWPDRSLLMQANADPQRAVSLLT